MSRWKEYFGELVYTNNKETVDYSHEKEPKRIIAYWKANMKK